MTGPATEGDIGPWESCRLAGRIRSVDYRAQLRLIWRRLQPALPLATWPGWVDHSQAHVLAVLQYLNRLIPTNVLDTLSEIEAFVLIAGTILHDIGMIPGPPYDPADTGSSHLDCIRQIPGARGGPASAGPSYVELRKQHGARGAQIVRREFSDYLVGSGELDAVCEIVKNHHGAFAPPAGVDPLAHLRAMALWVRLADELDFGPRRAPAWLLDVIRPDRNELEHWRAHNLADEPAIDLRLLRIRVSGQVRGEALIRKLRSEFEAPERQEIQSNFLLRGQEPQGQSCFFIIWDETRKVPERASRGVDPPPLAFSDEEHFLAGSYLYSVGYFAQARRCLEHGARRQGSWAAPTAAPFFYHYLKTLIGLGEFERAYSLIENQADASFSQEVQAGLRVAAGLAGWKLGQLESARVHFLHAAQQYSELSANEPSHKVNEADAHALYAAMNLAMIRKRGAAGTKIMTRDLARALQRAEKLFAEYEKLPGMTESHYRGRFWGVKAFAALLQIERQADLEPSAWDEALAWAERAYGGPGGVNRAPFGVLCGKYCAAAVRFHKHLHCPADAGGAEALAEAADLIAEVCRAYDELFGPDARIPGLWPQIHGLSLGILQALPEAQRARLEGCRGTDEPAEPVDIFTPLR